MRNTDCMNTNIFSSSPDFDEAYGPRDLRYADQFLPKVMIAASIDPDGQLNERARKVSPAKQRAAFNSAGNGRFVSIENVSEEDVAPYLETRDEEWKAMFEQSGEEYDEGEGTLLSAQLDQGFLETYPSKEPVPGNVLCEHYFEEGDMFPVKSGTIAAKARVLCTSSDGSIQKGRNRKAGAKKVWRNVPFSVNVSVKKHRHYELPQSA